jgi:hypothetical protein
MDKLDIHVQSNLFRGYLWVGQRKRGFQVRWPLKEVSIHKKNSITEQEKDDLLIQVTA